jgi:transposase
MAAKKNISQSAWVEAIAGSGGIVSEIAKRLNVHASTVYRCVKNNSVLENAMREEREACKDMAERNIREALEAKNLQVSMWYLARQASDRGYGTQNKSEKKFQIGGDVHLCLPDDGRDSGEPDADSTQ